MCVKAVRISDTTDLTFRVLDAVIGDATQPCARRVRFGEIAEKLGISEELVRYHVRKLVEQGYLRALSSGYEPTGRILFIDDEAQA